MKRRWNRCAVMAGILAALTVGGSAAAAESETDAKISSPDQIQAETSYMLTNINSDIEVLEANSGEIVDQWYDWGGIECRWYLEPQNDGFYITARVNGKHLASAGDEDGAQVILQDPEEGSAAQLWQISTVEDGVFTIRNNENDMYLSIEYDGDGDGNAVIQTVEQKLSSTWTIEEKLYQGEPEQPDADPTGEPSVALTRENLITDNLIELVFDRDVRYATNKETYEIRVDGTPIDDFSIASYFDNILSIRLTEAIADPENADISVTIANQYVRDADDNYLADGETYQITYQPYYTKFCTSKCGIVIKSCDLVKDETLQYTADVVDIMASKRQDVADALVEAGADIALYPAEQTIYYIPEDRELYSPEGLTVEGFGGTIEEPTTALSAANVERDYEHALYPDNNVLAHEFGHAFHLIGIAIADPDLFDKIDETYQKVCIEEGKWKDTYTGSNRDEYFGQITAAWFDGLDESPDGSWTGVLGPVNTRDELKEYDPEGYELLSEIYPEDQYFTSPWAKEDVKNHFDVNGDPID